MKEKATLSGMSLFSSLFFRASKWGVHGTDLTCRYLRQHVKVSTFLKALFLSLSLTYFSCDCWLTASQCLSLLSIILLLFPLPQLKEHFRHRLEVCGRAYPRKFANAYFLHPPSTWQHHATVPSFARLFRKTLFFSIKPQRLASLLGRLFSCRKIPEQKIFYFSFRDKQGLIPQGNGPVP